ncbi:YceI family protein [Lujinxingia vulgaris]|uniref:YceI family protein n=1 Tax=Lujinxingia vulgaris TaxID=2600176 RepID=A0A5C6XBZ4_9DELT|nr:YceI family protein [Lujinxingia vulgaris]TXD38931.1 YceI family protein [Lujinxingia vulgaris]
MPGYIEFNPSTFFAAVIVRNDDSRMLSRMGHDHVVRAIPAQRRIAIDAETIASISFELTFPARELVVDADEDRPRVGLPGTVSLKDRNATADNMLAKNQLDAARHPELRFACHGITTGPNAHMQASLTVRTTRFNFDFPLDLHVDPNHIRARGQVQLSHADLGLTPYRAPLGALQNRPELTFVVELDADINPAP